eukprot:5589912-Prymnesium_polylepis.1
MWKAKQPTRTGNFHLCQETTRDAPGRRQPAAAGRPGTSLNVTGCNFVQSILCVYLVVCVCYGSLGRRTRTGHACGDAQTTHT